MSNDKEKIYEGVAIADFIVGTKKPKKYAKGDKFSTKIKAVYDGMIAKHRIK